jgi:hypothetical protein
MIPDTHTHTHIYPYRYDSKCIYIYIYTYIHTYIHKGMIVLVHLSRHDSACVNIHMTSSATAWIAAIRILHSCVHECACVLYCTCGIYVYVHIYIYIYIYMLCSHVCMCVLCMLCMHVYAMYACVNASSSRDTNSRLSSDDMCGSDHYDSRPLARGTCIQSA